MTEVAALGLRVDGVSNIDQAEKSLSGFSSAATKADKSSGQLTKTSSGLKGSYDRLNSSLSSAAKSMLALGAAAVSLAAVSRTLTGFEDSMAQVAAITRANTQELKAMREMAKSLGATTKFSASEAADGIRFLGMAGFSASESLASIPAVLNLATASAMGLADAADIATNIMSGFGIQAQNAAKVADVLAAASSRSNTTVQQLGGAMSTVAPISAALGISLEDTAAAIGTLSDAGIQGERAGTAMRGALASLAGPTTQAQKTLKDLGLTVQEVNPQTNDLATVFGRLNEAGLNTAQAMTIFGREAASGALVLTQASGRVGEFGDILRNASGEAQRMADIMADSLAGDFKNLESAVESIIIAMGEAGLTAIMRGTVQLVTELVLSGTRLLENLGKVTNFIGSSLSPAFSAMGHVLTTVARNADAILIAISAMYAPAVLGGVAAITRAIGVGLVGAVNALTVAMAANPIGFLIRVLATATTAVYVFRDDVKRIFGIEIPSTFREMALAGAWVMDSLLGGFTGNVAAIWSLFVTLGTNMWTFFENIFNQIREAASAWVHGIAQDLNSLPFVNIDLGDQYKAPKPSGYLDFAEEMERAFQAGQKYLGLREKLALSFAEDDLWAAGTKAFEDYTKALDDLSGGGGGGDDNGGGLPKATDALRKWLAESQNATTAANLMTAAYLQGGEAIAAATRQVQIEQQVLEHGAGSRNAVTAAINAQTAALDRQDIAKQINDLREQNSAAQSYVRVLAEQSKGSVAGRRALEAYNKEQAISALLAGKSREEVEGLVKAYGDLFSESQNFDRTTEAMIELNRLVDSTRTDQEKYNIELQRLVALRPYAQTAEQAEALERAIGNLQRENSAWITFTEDAVERMNKSFADMWNDVFTGSKNAFEGMKRGFRQMLAEMAHAAITQPIVISIGNALMGTNKPGGIGDGGGIFGALNNVKSAYQGVTKAVNGLTGLISGGSAIIAAPSAIASLSTTIGATSFASTSFAAGMSGGALVPGLGVGAGGAGVGVGVAAGGASGAAGAGGLVSGLSTAAPWIAGGLFLADALGLFDDTPKTRHAQMAHAELMGDGRMHVSTRDSRQSEEVQIAAAKYAEESINAALGLFDQIGIDAEFKRFMTLMESSILGDKQGVGSSATIRIGDLEHEIGLAVESSWTKHGFGGWSDADMFPRLQTDIQLTLLEAFQVAGDALPSVLSGMLEGVDIRSLGAEQAQALAQQFSLVVEQVSSLQSALEQLPFANLRDLSFDAAANLIQFAGGLENLNSGISTYFQNFYSQEEQLAFATERMTGAFADLGFTMPDLSQGVDSAKYAYRALVDSLDMTTEEGQRAYASLMQLSGGFAELVTGLDDLANATARAAEEAARAAEQAARNEFERLARVGEYQLQTAVAQLNAAWSAVQQHAQQEISRLEQSFSQTDSLWSAYQSRVRSLESELGGLLTTISRGVADLRGQVAATAQMQYAQARSVISTAVLTEQLPQTASLTEAMRVAQQGVAAGRYGSAFDQRRAYLLLSNELQALADIAEPELDIATAQLEQMEKQLNRLRGIESVSEMSLSQLQRQLTVAMSTEESARAQKSAIEAQLDWAQRQYNATMGVGVGVSDLASAFRAFSVSLGAVQDAKTNPINRDQQYLNAKLDQLRRENPYYGGIDWTTASASDLAAYLRREGMTPEQHYRLHGRYEGLSYDTGTSYVPYDMLANIHKGEIIVNPSDSDMLRKYGILVRSVGAEEFSIQMRAFRAEFAAYAAEQKAYGFKIAKENTKTARQLEEFSVLGMPVYSREPLKVETV